MKFLYDIISALTFRIRGGLRMYKDHKFPLNKLYFAIWVACMTCIFRGWELRLWLVMFIATYVSTMCFGWGEYAGCVLGIGKPNSKRSDCAEIDEFIDNLYITIKGKKYMLIDFPILFGWVGLSLRGLILSFIIGLALNSVLFMPCGVFMGTIYYLCGLFARKILKRYDKTGWNLSEWVFGAFIGLCVRFVL
ncbi:MAG: hypothetical protein UE295_06795 [Acutalibacteraceae bacterium]|nr:hypothetical protein [Acutalibacteraceae bacterium]